MTQISFRFDPHGPGVSDDLADKLERVFGATRWVHNRAMIAQWEALRAGNVPPPLSVLVQMCIDEPAQEAETSWLNLVPRGVLLDELNDLDEGWDDLRDISDQRQLPLKKKKEAQEIIFPAGTFTLKFVPGVGLGVELEKTGQIVSSHGSLKSGEQAEAVKIQRTIGGVCTATVFFS